ncbi:MAG: hypothetical protein MUE94_02730 [Verrucomicrobia bacterium]|nr:hypothetical protein [Verrucomicrobiota bacterium]
MTAPSQRLSTGVDRRAPAWLCFLLPLALAWLAITGRSFWIDECVTAEYVSQLTLSEWRHDLLATDYAEAQTPFYLLYLWGWEKLFGQGEWSLRVAALPWFVVGVGLFLTALRPCGRLGWAAMAVTISSAFVWYYLNEARLYSMQLGTACAVVACLVQLARMEALNRAMRQKPQDSTSVPGIGVEPEGEGQARRDPLPRERRKRWWFRAFLFGTLVLSGISIIGMLWAGAAVLAFGVIFSAAGAWTRIKSCTATILLWSVGMSWLAGYYLSTVLRGARASSLATTTPQTVVFVGYELLGFTGLGPGRDALREQGVRALATHLPLLTLFGLLLGIVLAAGFAAIWRSDWRKRAVGIGACVSLPALFLLATGVLRHFRVLGRHCTPLLVVVLLVLAMGMAWLWRRGRWGRITAALYLALALLSAIQVRWATRHRKDDYRAAAAFSRSALAAGQSVWWAAAPQGAAYYGLPLTDDPQEAGSAYAIFGQSAEALANMDPPDLVVGSRPDIYDYRGGLADQLSRGGFSVSTNFSGFKVWTRTP